MCKILKPDHSKNTNLYLHTADYHDQYCYPDMMSSETTTMTNHQIPLVIVDSANVVGSKPDGWWNDRIGANTRLRDSLQKIHKPGLQDLPGPIEVILVVEGEARDVKGIEGVHVESAGDDIGDNKIVELVEVHVSRRMVVITSDMELQDRVAKLGAEVRGARAVPRPQNRDFFKNRQKMLEEGGRGTSTLEPVSAKTTATNSGRMRGIKRKRKADDTPSASTEGEPRKPQKPQSEATSTLTRKQRRILKWGNAGHDHGMEPAPRKLNPSDEIIRKWARS